MKKLLVLVFALGMPFTVGCAANKQMQAKLQACETQNKALAAQIEQIKKDNKLAAKKKADRMSDFIDAVMSQAKKSVLEARQAKAKADQLREQLIQANKKIVSLQKQIAELKKKL